MVKVPTFGSKLRKNIEKVPELINGCSGIGVFGQLLKSFLFSTVVAIIRNTNANANANAIIAVYPFTPRSLISHALILAADKPVICGVGGGITTGNRPVELALHTEFQGALGVVLNKPTPNELITRLKWKIDIPLTINIVSEKDDIKGRIAAGVDIFNFSGANKTTDIVKRISDLETDIAILATGDHIEDDIIRTIDAGANAISYTPPSTSELFKDILLKYRSA